MARAVSVQPPGIVAIVGSRNAAMYRWCERCGGIRAKQARVCLACFQEVRTDRGPRRRP